MDRTIPADRAPHRATLAASALVDSLGDGLYLAGSALFFTRGLGLSVGSVGLGLSVAGVLGLLGSSRLGRLADRFGPRGVLVAMMTGQGLSVAGYVLVGNVAGLVIAATLAALCRQGAQGARGALIGRFGGADASTLRSYLHAVTNVGIAAGAAAAGLAIARDTHTAYLTLILADVATFLVAAAIAATLPSVRPLPRDTHGATGRAVRDYRYLATTFLNGVVALQFVISGYLLPLWVLLHTHAPRWISSQLLMLNTVLIVLFQVRVSGRFKGLARSARAYWLGGLYIAGGCVLFGASTFGGTAAIATVLLLLAMVAASAGELLTLAGGFGISFALAPPAALGEYQAVWAAGSGAAFAVGPGLLTLICLKGGAGGWLALAAVMVASSVTLAAVASRTHIRTWPGRDGSAHSVEPTPPGANTPSSQTTHDGRAAHAS
jgi:MFS family permease